MSTTVRPVPVIPRTAPPSSPIARAAAWVGNKIQGIIYGIAFGHLGKFAMVAIYYILTQWLHGQYIGSWHSWDVKFVWDHLLTNTVPHGGLVPWLSEAQWTTARHTIRSFGEGLYGALLYQQLLADPVRYLKQYASPWLIISTPFVVAITGAIVALPMFFIGLPILHHFTHSSLTEVALQKHPDLLHKIYTDSYDAVIVGILAGFAVRRVARRALCTNMAYFCRLWRRAGLGPSLVMPAGMRHQIRAFKYEPQLMDSSIGGYLAAAIIFIALVTATLAGYGFYILDYVAH